MRQKKLPDLYNISIISEGITFLFFPFLVVTFCYDEINNVIFRAY